MGADTLEPGERPEEQFPEEGAVAVAEAPVVSEDYPSPNLFCRDTCANCRRPLIHMGERGWKHMDARIDMETNPAFCVPELYVEPQTAWGFLATKDKSPFEVSGGASQVRGGWSGGGVK